MHKDIKENASVQLKCKKIMKHEGDQIYKER